MGLVAIKVQARSKAPPLRNMKFNLCMRREPGIFSLVNTAKGRMELDYMWTYPKTQNRETSEGSRQLTTRIKLSGSEYHTHRALKTKLVE